MAQGKKRAGNLKAKAKRERSWARNQAAKKIRIAEQGKREERNRELGSTGKERANLAVKEARRIDAALERSPDES